MMLTGTAIGASEEHLSLCAPRLFCRSLLPHERLEPLLQRVLRRLSLLPVRRLQHVSLSVSWQDCAGRGHYQSTSTAAFLALLAAFGSAEDAAAAAASLQRFAAFGPSRSSDQRQS